MVAVSSGRYLPHSFGRRVKRLEHQRQDNRPNRHGDQDLEKGEPALPASRLRIGLSAHHTHTHSSRLLPFAGPRSKTREGALRGRNRTQWVSPPPSSQTHHS